MSEQRLIGTLLWTNLIEAIKTDFPALQDVDLDRAGLAVTRVLNEVAGVYLLAGQEPAAAEEVPPFRFMYRNWKGELALRTVTLPGCPRYGATEHHPEPCWLLPAFDLERGALREFRMADIQVSDETKP